MKKYLVEMHLIEKPLNLVKNREKKPENYKTRQ